MKPLTDEQVDELTEAFETLASNIDTIAGMLRDFDPDDRKSSTRSLCEAIVEDGLWDEDSIKKLATVRRMLKAHEAGDFDGMDGSTMGSAVATEALWSVALDPSAVTWAPDGTGVVDLGDIDFTEVDDVPDMGGVLATFELDSRRISLTFEDDEWGECTATGVLDEGDERLAALIGAQVENG